MTLVRVQAGRRPWRAAVLVIVAGAVGGAASLAAALGAFGGGAWGVSPDAVSAYAEEGRSVQTVASFTLFVLGTCLLTGLWEEAVFRLAVIEAFERLSMLARGVRLPWHRLCDGIPAVGAIPVGITLRAAVLSAVLFGIAHTSLGDMLPFREWLVGEGGAVGGAPFEGGTASVLTTAAAWLKFLQAALFGFVMACMYQRTRSLWKCAGLHALFDVLYLGPAVVAAGAFPDTYAVGSVPYLVMLVATIALLAGAVAQAWRLPCEEAVVRGMDGMRREAG